MKGWLDRHFQHKNLARWLLLPAWWLFDHLWPKDRYAWAFFVHPLQDDQFIENSRAVFEQIKADPIIAKYIFSRGMGRDFRIEDACNTHIVDLQSLRGLWRLARCGTYLLTNAIALDMSWRWSDGSFSVVRANLRRRNLVNLWHGIPLKRLFGLAHPQQGQRADRVAYRRRERAFYDGLIASSDVDSYAMAAIFQPIPYAALWVTGLPRNDFLCMADEALPGFLRDEVDYIRRLKGGCKLITYAPTFREKGLPGAQCYQFSDEQIEHLKALLRRHNAVLGFRMHYFRKGEQLFNLERYVDGQSIVDLGHQAVSEIAPVIRESDLVITDYSSVYIDALYLDKPVISFAYDLEAYSRQQNGLLYDMQLAFPGPVVVSFEALLAVLEQELDVGGQVASPRYQTCKKLFFKYADEQNSARVIARIHALNRTPQE
ncbi:CDP-glycerol glycerophosphotransferase family protein [Pseudomonas sp.]|uniref:CDP-glycerol glycerophosphotransferase family protein n=1 Tax=Pseudomonas sp. TaxID=306 RepID=UPI002C7EB584|nr:CDP-glycerol glycerophosphotransferase family protein [Pseudomonas sp.]HUE91244.1 CDP-glycerol glycerophosphotransferase family protein [Pseudomonas sp.]